MNGRRRTGKRKRDPLLPITLAEMRDWSALMAWCQRDARIDREATGPVPLIQAAALACGTADEFLATVEAGIIDGNWGSLVGVSQAEFKSRTHGAVK